MGESSVISIVVRGDYLQPMEGAYVFGTSHAHTHAPPAANNYTIHKLYIIFS